MCPVIDIRKRDARTVSVYLTDVDTRTRVAIEQRTVLRGTPGITTGHERVNPN